MWSPEGRQIPTRNPASQNKPFLGCIAADSIRPPHSVGILKQSILRAEAIDPSTPCELYVNPRTNDPPAEDNSFLVIFYSGPGCKPNTPVGLVISIPTPEATPTSTAVNLSEPVILNTTPTHPQVHETFNIKVRAQQYGCKQIFGMLV
jgi:hypothetical protein